MFRVSFLKISLVLFSLIILCPPSVANGASLNAVQLEKELTEITRHFHGRVGACVRSGETVACTKGDERFSMQSVMKLLVGVAVLDRVDHAGWNLSDSVMIHKKDLSLYVQPLAKLVNDSAGFRTTIGDLVRRAVIESDSAATDILIARLGGPAAIQSFLQQKGVSGIRLDRDERHLQTEIVGLSWKPEFVDPAVLDRAIASVPQNIREQAYRQYQKDARDTATPLGMVNFLSRLQKGELLSGTSTRFVLQAMEECVTFPNRLKAGAPAGWKVSHKTGTSGSWKGVTAATNDVGLLTAPSGEVLSISVFVADSSASSSDRSAMIARISELAIHHFR